MLLLQPLIYNRRGACPKDSRGERPKGTIQGHVYTYILKSVKDGRYYYGSCDDLDIRLAKHNWGR